MMSSLIVPTLNILYVYNGTQTYTSAVYGHISCFSKYSKHRSFFCSLELGKDLDIDLRHFDAIAIHYSIRLPFDQLSMASVEAIAAFNGLKFLFIQDEYDHTKRAWHWIKALGIQLVFTVVPERGVSRVYPPQEFPATRFISTLTGYVPDDLTSTNTSLPSQRSLIVGYRGRPLPIRYGKLGIEKIDIGRVVKTYCDVHEITNDIAWSEEERIYGDCWHGFIKSCRSMLGSESGSNVFDWDGTLFDRITRFRKSNPQADDREVYETLVRPLEIDGIMNQVSPRIFEAIAARTVLVLFDGDYSGVVQAGKHFISVNKDGSNLPEVMRMLQDGKYVDEMADRAYNEVILAGNYSYQSFVNLVDQEVNVSYRALNRKITQTSPNFSSGSGLALITTSPVRAKPPQIPPATLAKATLDSQGPQDLAKRLAMYLWWRQPELIRHHLRPWKNKFFNKG